MELHPVACPSGVETATGAAQRGQDDADEERRFSGSCGHEGLTEMAPFAPTLAEGFVEAAL